VFDPGPGAGPADDRLLAVDRRRDTFEDLIEIHPDSGAPTELCGLVEAAPDLPLRGAPGLAWSRGRSNRRA
jgi:hypothetical protein